MQSTRRIFGISGMVAAIALALTSAVVPVSAAAATPAHIWGPGAAPVPAERSPRLLSHDEARNLELPRQIVEPADGYTAAARSMSRIYDAIEEDPTNVSASAPDMRTRFKNAGGLAGLTFNRSAAKPVEAPQARIPPTAKVELTGTNEAKPTAKQSFTCAITWSSTVKCWDTKNAGQHGNEATMSASMPQDVVGLPSSAVSVAASLDLTCASLANGSVWCWGRDTNGEVGDGGATFQAKPFQVIAGGVSRLAAGPNHVCALMSVGNVDCWATNGNMGLGVSA